MSLQTNRAGIYQVLMALEWGDWARSFENGNHEQPMYSHDMMAIPDSTCQVVRPQKSYQGQQIRDQEVL